MKLINFNIYFVIIIVSLFVDYIHLEESKTLYEILNIKNNASILDIKKAFRKISIKYHPDKIVNFSSDEKSKFTLIFNKAKEAYEILSNEELKKIYDEEGLSSVNKLQNKRYKSRSNEEFEEVYSNYFKNNKFSNINKFDVYEDEELFSLESSNIIRLNSKNINKIIYSYKPSLILFYNYKDIFKNIIDEYTILSDKLEGIINQAYVSCRFDTEFCKKYDVNVSNKVYDVVIDTKIKDNNIFNKNNQESNKDTPKLILYPGYKLPNSESFVDFKGTFKWKNIVGFVSSYMLNFVNIINSYNHKYFINQNKNKNKLILITKNSNIPIKYKMLSKYYHDIYDFGIINFYKGITSTKSIYDFYNEMYKIKNLPSIFIIKNSNIDTAIEYKGEWKLDQIKKFLSNNLNKSNKPSLISLNYLDKQHIYDSECFKENDNKKCIIILFKNHKKPIQFYVKLIEKLFDRYLNEELFIYYVDLTDFKYLDHLSTYIKEEYFNSNSILFKFNQNKYKGYKLSDIEQNIDNEIINYIDAMLANLIDIKNVSIK